MRFQIMDEAAFEIWATGDDDLTTVTEAARRLGVSRQSVLARIKRHSLPARRDGRRWLIPAAALAPREKAA
ncbi:MAG: helix-turn-helix domain-containing protein [Propionibacteriaceae bacterium]|nr:helix-turn-helix domain-containing protein [Propionibacteriaceae bacterium]